MVISVIIPVYNKEKYVRKCIDSVLEQTYDNLEIILVDDGSTDGSGEICEQYSLKDPRIKVIHKENGGLSSARNAGIASSSGNYIAFIDADDFISKDYFQTLIELSSEYDADISQCGRYRSSEPLPNDSCRVTVYENDEKNALVCGELYIPTVNAVCKLFKSDLFENVRFHEGIIHEDEEIAPRLLYAANKLVHIDKSMYCVVMSENSITRSAYSLKKLDKLTALENIMDFYLEKNMSKQYALTLSKYICFLGKNIRAVKRYFPNRRDILKQLNNKLRSSRKKMMKNKDLSLKDKIGTLLISKGII